MTASDTLFCASIVIVFFLGGCVGFVIGKRRSHDEEAKRFGAHGVDMNATASGGPKEQRIEPDENVDSQPTITPAAVGEKTSETDGEEEDGPTMVLRGSLDLIASKWDKGRTTKNHVNGNPDTSSTSSAVVKYLSPEDMTELLFSKARKGGDNTSETFCLDEYSVSDSDSDGCEDNPEAFIKLLSLIQKFSVNTSHPYFFNQLFGSLDPIALASEIVALSVNTSVYTYETAPVFTLIEREVFGQLGKLVFGHNKDDNDHDEGDDEEFEGEGLMIPGGSLANLTAMHAARHRWKVLNGFIKETQTTSDDEVPMISVGSEGADEQSYWVGEEEKKLEDPPPHDDSQSPPDLVAFVSSEAHYSTAKAARVLGLREDDLIVIPTHSDGRMNVEVLAKMIEELELDLLHSHGSAEATKRKRVPFFVACTAGSTVRGSFDEIAKIVKVCRDYEARASHTNINNGTMSSSPIWVHVDGAWGGSAIFSSRQSVRASTHMTEIKYADSFTFNPHKMLGAPQQTTAFIVRHRHAIRDSNASNAKYLFDPRKNGAEYDLGDLSYTCGRRTDAVKLWAMWKYYGRSGLGRMVDQKVDELEMFVEELGQREGTFALACKPWLFNVNFFYFPPRIRRVLEERRLLKPKGASSIESVLDDDDDGIQIPDDIAKDLSNVSVQLKLRLHEAGEMMIPYQPLNNQKADCFRLVLAGKKDLTIKDIHHILDTMEKYGADL